MFSVCESISIYLALILCRQRDCRTSPPCMHYGLQIPGSFLGFCAVLGLCTLISCQFQKYRPFGRRDRKAGCAVPTDPSKCIETTSPQTHISLFLPHFLLTGMSSF